MRTSDEHGKINAAKWDKRAETYDQKRFDFMRFIQKRTVDLIGLKPGMALLDVGCGTGWATRYVASLAAGQGRFCGIDISPGMIERAEAQSTEGTEFRLGNSEQLPYTDGSFDRIICTNSFHHYRDPLKATQEFSRVLKIGGMLYLTDLTSDTLFLELIDRRQRKREAAHVRFHNTKEFKEYFRETGLEYCGAKMIAITTMKVHIGRKEIRIR